MATTEERLAALEAKMAQLTATTPTEYYTHQYSGEEIDDAVDRALTGGALDTSVTNVSNQLGTFVRPNLLDNWYFRRPVNQRGQTEYSNPENNGTYSIDRWLAYYFTGKITLSDNGVLFNSVDSTSAVFRQKICTKDDYKYLVGKQVTISALINGELSVCTGVLPEYSNNAGFNSVASTDRDKRYFIRIFCAGNFLNFDIYINAGDPIELPLLAAKLELGPTQTLAHREGDKWVINEVPEYGEQLRRCQRYYYQVHYNQYETIGFAYDGPEYAFIIIPLPTEMRGATPTLKIIGDISIGGKVRTLTGCSCHGCEAIIGVNYTAQPSSAGATYAYSTSAGGVTISIIYDL